MSAAGCEKKLMVGFFLKKNVLLGLLLGLFPQPDFHECIQFPPSLFSVFTAEVHALGYYALLNDRLQKWKSFFFFLVADLTVCVRASCIKAETSPI